MSTDGDREADLADELVISGTPEYMAPEIAAGGAPLPASDLYGAGVILYELLTGTTPFCGGTAVEIMLRQARDPVIPPSECRPERGIPAEIDRVVLQALEKRPGARFANAAAFSRGLRAAAAGLSNSRSRISTSDESTRAPSSDRNAGAPRSARRLARGSDCRGAMRADPDTLRRQIGGALRRGDITAIADGYLALANALVERRQAVRATSELQEGIDILTGGSAIQAPAMHRRVSIDSSSHSERCTTMPATRDTPGIWQRAPITARRGPTRSVDVDREEAAHGVAGAGIPMGVLLVAQVVTGGVAYIAAALALARRNLDELLGLAREAFLHHL